MHSLAPFVDICEEMQMDCKRCPIYNTSHRICSLCYLFGLESVPPVDWRLRQWTPEELARD